MWYQLLWSKCVAYKQKGNFFLTESRWVGKMAPYILVLIYQQKHDALDENLSKKNQKRILAKPLPSLEMILHTG